MFWGKVFSYSMFFLIPCFSCSVAPTYESATSRMFYHGRTETTRSCSMETKEWCQAMFDENFTVRHSLASCFEYSFLFLSITFFVSILLGSTTIRVVEESYTTSRLADDGCLSRKRYWYTRSLIHQQFQVMVSWKLLYL